MGTTARPGGLALVLALVLGGPVLGGLVACRAPRADLVAPEAATEFAAARAWLARAGESVGDPARVRAHERALRASALAPAWVAPRRFLDELLRPALLLPRAYERHRAALDDSPGDAGARYLLGRLEGEASAVGAFERAALDDPALAWAHHGRAHLALRRLRLGTAEGHERRALALARDPFEHRTFAGQLADVLILQGRGEEAERVLREALEVVSPSSRDAAALQARLVRTALAAGEGRGAEEPAFLAGVRLLRERGADLGEDEIERLSAALAEARALEGAAQRARALEAALAPHRASPGARRALARLLAAGGEAGAARALATGSGAGRGERVLAFRAGRYADGVEGWLAGLPRLVLAADGLPRDRRLRAVVRSARDLDASSDATEPLRELGDALVAAGWLEEALAVGAALAARSPEAGLDVRARASAGLELLAGLDALFAAVADGRAFHGPGGVVREPPDDLRELLRWLDPFRDAYRGAVGPAEAGTPTDRPSASPLVSLGFLGTVVDPGPGPSAVPGSDSGGEEGSGGGAPPAPGLATLLGELGRFGLVGRGLGRDPDAVVLPELWSERARGEHLGAPWQGLRTIAEGRDVRALAERRGARLSGAALHEGYWIDLESVHRDLERWRRLEVRFGPDPSGTSAAERALGLRGRPLAAGERAGDWAPPLGAGDRVRLARIVDSRAGRAGPVGVDELLAVVAVHEEAHLCDRARFLPLSEHLGAALGLLWRCGFSPALVLQRLEYRAQLVALAVVKDPRLPLAEILDAAESAALGGRARPVPHAAAYARLARDLLRRLEARGHGDGRLLVHGLHALEPEDVRAAALELAEDEGLVGS